MMAHIIMNKRTILGLALMTLLLAEVRGFSQENSLFLVYEKYLEITYYNEENRFLKKYSDLLDSEGISAEGFKIKKLDTIFCFTGLITLKKNKATLYPSNIFYSPLGKKGAFKRNYQWIEDKRIKFNVREDSGGFEDLLELTKPEVYKYDNELNSLVYFGKILDLENDSNKDDPSNIWFLIPLSNKEFDPHNFFDFKTFWNGSFKDKPKLSFKGKISEQNNNYAIAVSDNGKVKNINKYSNSRKNTKPIIADLIGKGICGSVLIFDTHVLVYSKVDMDDLVFNAYPVLLKIGTEFPNTFTLKRLENQ